MIDEDTLARALLDVFDELDEPYSHGYSEASGTVCVDGYLDVRDFANRLARKLDSGPRAPETPAHSPKQLTEGVVVLQDGEFVLELSPSRWRQLLELGLTLELDLRFWDGSAERAYITRSVG